MEKTQQELMAEALGKTETPEVAQPTPTEVEPAKVEEKPAEVVPPAKPAESEKTMAELLKTEEPVPNLVPEAALINEKKGRKEAERKLKALEKQIADGATTAEVTEDIEAILEEYGLDDANKQFYGKMAKAMQAAAERKADEKIAATNAPKEAEDRKNAIDKAFTTAFADALERNPEFNGIAVPAVIKAMSMLPENADKTFSQILEDAYGASIQGKRTIESSAPGGTKEPNTIDFDKAGSDSSYFESIMANPTLKAEYNKSLAKRIRI